MGMAQLVVTAVLIEGRCKSEVARDYGISRRWVITLVQRYLAEGEAGLAPRSRRPRSSPNQTPTAVEEEIVALRKDLVRRGHEAGAATIAAHLQRRHARAPATSTVWRILSDRGFVTAQPHKRPKSSYVRFAAEQPNERWQTDLTHWTLADGTDVEVIKSRSSSRGHQLDRRPFPALPGLHRRPRVHRRRRRGLLPRHRRRLRRPRLGAIRQRRGLHRPLPRPRRRRPEESSP